MQQTRWRNKPGWEMRGGRLAVAPSGTLHRAFTPSTDIVSEVTAVAV